MLVVGSPEEVPEALNRMTLARGREAKVVAAGDYFVIVYRAEKCLVVK